MMKVWSKVVMMVAAAILSVCLTPSPAAAQVNCTPSESVTTALEGSQSVIDNEIFAHANTYTKLPQYMICWSGYWRTELWFNGVGANVICSTFSGATGGPYNGGCIALSANTFGPNEGGSAGATARITRYGCLQVRSRHWNVFGAWEQVAEKVEAACAGNPPLPPPDAGCDEYLWDYELNYAYCISPIIMPLADKRIARARYRLTNVENGVLFDLDADGIQDRTSWTHQNSGLAFLALDRNGNGKIDDGKELFGNFTHPGKGNGFSALLVDAGRVGLIDDGHPLFEKLLLWEDENHNGLSEPYEIHKFSDHYVGIGLSYEPDTLRDRHGNEFRFKGNATIKVGTSKKYPKQDREVERSRMIDIWDVFFTVQR